MLHQRGSFNRSVWSHPLFSMCSCINHVKSSHCRIEPAWSSVSVYVASAPTPCSLPHESRHSHTRSLLILCWCWHASVEPGPGQTGRGHPRLVPAPAPHLHPALFFFHSIKRHLDMFTVLSDYIKPGVHRVRGLIMVVSYIRNNSADNAGCSK